MGIFYESMFWTWHILGHMSNLGIHNQRVPTWEVPIYLFRQKAESMSSLSACQESPGW